MKDNYNLRITSSMVELVPYRPCFVSKYHEWMKDESILEATASEPLSIDEEYEMQRTWHIDPKKCTFIILIKQLENVGDEISRMAGDVNLFLHDYDDPFNAEIEVMIAEEKYRRMGMARESLELIMRYGVEKLGIRRFFAKIHETNEASLALFYKIGFTHCNFVPAFGEHELELVVRRGDKDKDATEEDYEFTEILKGWRKGEYSNYSNAIHEINAIHERGK